MRGVSRGDDTAHSAYNKARAKVKKLIRQERRKFEKGIARKVKTNPKKFWAYTRKKLKTKSGIAPLLENIIDKDSLKYDDKEKANILQKQFISVFTKEGEGDIPSIGLRSNKQISNIDITEELFSK